jgi:hypothetical protein
VGDFDAPRGVGRGAVPTRRSLRLALRAGRPRSNALSRENTGSAGVSPASEGDFDAPRWAARRRAHPALAGSRRSARGTRSRRLDKRSAVQQS